MKKILLFMTILFTICSFYIMFIILNATKNFELEKPLKLDIPIYETQDKIKELDSSVAQLTLKEALNEAEKVVSRISLEENKDVPNYPMTACNDKIPKKIISSKNPEVKEIENTKSILAEYKEVTKKYIDVKDICNKNILSLTEKYNVLEKELVRQEQLIIHNDRQYMLIGVATSCMTLCFIVVILSKNGGKVLIKDAQGNEVNINCDGK